MINKSLLKLDIVPLGCKGGTLTWDQALCRAYLPKEVAEIKLDGARYLFYALPAQNYLTGRRVSKVTGQLTQKQDSLPRMRDYKVPAEYRFTVLDGELVSPWGGYSADASTAISQGVALYYPWDVLFFKGTDVRQHTLQLRRSMLVEFWAAIGGPPWMRVVYQFRDPVALLRQVIKEGGEGIIVKNLDLPYGVGWIKVKKVETHDCVICGFADPTEGKNFDKGWIRGVKLAQWFPQGACRGGKGVESPLTKKNYKLIEVGQASGFSDSVRDYITKNKQDLLWSVIEIKAQFRIPNSTKFRSPRFLRFRTDKDVLDCNV